MFMMKKLSKIEKEWTTMKKIVYICLANGIAWVWCSYILAFFGKDQIAESLSQVAITEIVGVVLVYAVKATCEQLSKHNHWPDKPVKEPKKVKEVSEATDVG